MNYVTYLDANVYRNVSHLLSIRTHIKDTDKNSYLQYNSYYTQQLSNNLPCNQFLRIKRNST